MRTGRQKSGAKISGDRQPVPAQQAPKSFPRAALDALRACIAVLDEHGIVLEGNRAWRDCQTCDHTPVIRCGVGDNFLLACDAATKDSVPGHPLANVIRKIMGGRTREVSLEYPCPDAGGTHWCEASVTRYFEAGSLRVVVACHDITARRQDEAKRRWMQMFLEAQANSSLDGILVVDPQGQKIFQNQRCIELWKIPLHIANSENDPEQIQWVLGMTKHPDSFLDGVTYLYAHPKEKRRDEIALKDGRFLDRYSAPVLGEDGTLYGRIWTFRDITENKQAEEDRRARKAAVRMNDAKSEFLSRMSHELRTPLNAILGFGQVLAMSSLDEQDGQCVQYILKGGRHLLSLVDEVLDLTRVEKGELSLHLATFSLEPVVRDCVGLVSKMAQERGIICTIQLGVAGETPIRADEQRLRQVLLNLLANAIAYNRERGQVEISCRQMPGGKIRCQVEDTGEGISPEGLTRLFVPFERLGREFGDTKGSGFGLVVSKGLAEAMGGTLGVESRLGVGSTFWIELPTAEPADALPLAKIFPVLALATRAEAASATTVLYVEDNLPNLQLVETVLRRLRPAWRFLSASDGIRGLQLVREQRPSMVLLDLQIPGLAGDAFLTALRSDPATAKLPVLLLSADATPQSQARLMALGANGYLTKPFQVPEIVEKIDALLRSVPQE